MRSARAAFVAATVLAIGAASLAAGGVLPNGAGATRPASEEVASFATQARISPSEAAQHLSDQSKLPMLARVAAAKLGSAYAGIWVDADGDQRIKLGVSVPSRDPIPGDLADTARAAIEAARLGNRVDLVKTDRSEAEVVDLQHRLEAELVTVNAGAEDWIDAEPNLVTGTVDLLRPRAVDITASQARFLDRAPQRFGSSIRVRSGPGKLRPFER
jgi:hypothetical protein